jgi:hypothetical protein
LAVVLWLRCRKLLLHGGLHNRPVIITNLISYQIVCVKARPKPVLVDDTQIFLKVKYLELGR